LFTTIYLEDFGKAFLLNCRHIKRNLAGTDRKIIDKYFASQKIKKLQIGCGGNILKGWLNSDYQPKSDKILHLDVTKSFPFKENLLDYVFSEHMVSQFTYLQGSKMFAECYRILKPGGKLRLSTPDLSFLIDLYKSEKSELQKAYLKWATESFIKTAPYCEDTFVINNFVRDWDHKFIYDEKVLRYSLEKVGFAEIKKCDLRDSEDEALQGLENVGRMPAGFLELESVTIEAIKL
jgi:predicted SAM-dependent methyltransferase